MQTILFVNKTGKLVIPPKAVLAETFSAIRNLPILFTPNWNESIVGDVCDMAVIEGVGQQPDSQPSKSSVVWCRSSGLWRRFLNTESVAVNAVALKCWSRSYNNRKPTSTLVVITGGEGDPQGDEFVFRTMEMKSNPITFIETGV